jgi:hypothetical protein
VPQILYALAFCHRVRQLQRTVLSCNDYYRRCNLAFVCNLSGVFWVSVGLLTCPRILRVQADLSSQHRIAIARGFFNTILGYAPVNPLQSARWRRCKVSKRGRRRNGGPSLRAWTYPAMHILALALIAASWYFGNQTDILGLLMCQQSSAVW